MACATPEKQKAAQAAWYQTKVKPRRAEWLAKNGPCRKCGSAENLEVDHIDRATKIHHGVWTWAHERREAELAKCQVLCRPCHQAKTAREMRADPDSIIGQNIRKTACKRGHPFDLFNTIWSKRGRECRQCHNEKRVRQRREKRAA